MKKFLLIVAALFILVGCSDESKLYKEKVKRYETLWQSVRDNDKFVSASSSYDISATLESGIYEIILGNPRIAMYDVEIVVVENNADYNQNKMMPSVGVFDGTYALVPGQIRKDKGYYGGMLLNGETDDASVNLKVLVSWKDSTRQQNFKEFFEFDFGTQPAS